MPCSIPALPGLAYFAGPLAPYIAASAALIAVGGLGAKQCSNSINQCRENDGQKRKILEYTRIALTAIGVVGLTLATAGTLAIPAAIFSLAFIYGGVASGAIAILTGGALWATSSLAVSAMASKKFIVWAYNPAN